jgi:hypothetical protein
MRSSSAAVSKMARSRRYALATVTGPDGRFALGPASSEAWSLAQHPFTSPAYPSPGGTAPGVGRLPRRISVPVTATASRRLRRRTRSLRDPGPGDRSPGIRRLSRKTGRTRCLPERAGPGPPMTDVLSLRRSGSQPGGDTRERRDSEWVLSSLLDEAIDGERVAVGRPGDRPAVNLTVV